MPKFKIILSGAEGAEKHDPYILGFKYAKQKLLDSEKITISSFSDYMRENGFDDNRLVKKVFMSIVIPGYDQGNIGETQLYRDGYIGSPDNEFDMLSSAYFNLVEMEELFEARKNAQQAKNFSTWALIVSVIATLAALVSLVRPQNLTIDSRQFELLTKSLNNVSTKS